MKEQEATFAAVTIKVRPRSLLRRSEEDPLAEARQKLDTLWTSVGISRQCLLAQFLEMYLLLPAKEVAESSVSVRQVMPFNEADMSEANNVAAAREVIESKRFAIAFL